MGLLTFDWSQISYLIPPLVIPWWAQVNIFIGFAIAFWAVAPAIYYTNVSCSPVMRFTGRSHILVVLEHGFLADLGVSYLRSLRSTVQHDARAQQ